MTAMVLFFALIMDWVWGWNARLIAQIGHPVIWAGQAISALEKRTNKGHAARRKRLGGLTALGLILLAAFIGQILTWGVFWLFPRSIAWGVLVILSWPLLASRSLYDHVNAIYLPLSEGDTEEARRQLRKIVGRDPQSLDAPAIRRAAIESLAENSSDGVVAPIFWGLIFGLPGLYAYKMINTLDSMIAYRNDRYEDYGFYAAKIDDWANFLPARLTAFLFLMGSPDIRDKQSIKSIQSDAHAHRSPNGGWPEAAMARRIGSRLSGPRVYDHRITDDPYLNAGAPDPDNAAFFKALTIFKTLIYRLLFALFLISLIYWLIQGIG